MAYNYHEAVKDDIREYIEENYGSVTEKMRSIIFLDILSDIVLDCYVVVVKHCKTPFTLQEPIS